MISKNEIEEKAAEFGINTSDVQRDYIFGWVLVGIYTVSLLKNQLVLKGGNALRKGYFLNTRFSADLDFGTENDIDENLLLEELNKVCSFIQENTGVVFEKKRNYVREKFNTDRALNTNEKRRIYKARLYFKDIYGNPDHITISVRLDIALFDKIYLPVQNRHIIHPYSDADQLRTEIKCLKLEEILAIKLKCLLQRLHPADLYDFIYSTLIKSDLVINKSEIITTFLKRTIFESEPGFVKSLFLDLPFKLFKEFWHRHLVCPKTSIIKFDFAVDNFKRNITELFGRYPVPTYASLRYFPSKFRNPIMQAGRDLMLLRITYKNISREIEPYSLLYKKPADKSAKEYLYVYDRTGGLDSGPGIKTFVCENTQSIENTNIKFKPQYEVELSRAGELGSKTYFGKSFSERRTKTPRSRVLSPAKTSVRRSKFRSGIVYVIQCPYCLKKFTRQNLTMELNKHKDKYGNDCYGRIGIYIDQKFRY